MSKTLKILIPIVCAVLLIIVLAGSLVVTQANEYTIIRQFGAVVRIIDQPGLSLKTPFVQSASTLPKTEMLYDLAVSDVITSDKKSMVADSFVLWRIDDPLKFIQTLSGSVATADRLVRNMRDLAGAPITDAVKMITLTPARIMGFGTKGLLAPGMDADLTVFDEDVRVSCTVAGGETVFSAF